MVINLVDTKEVKEYNMVNATRVAFLPHWHSSPVLDKEPLTQGGSCHFGTACLI